MSNIIFGLGIENETVFLHTDDKRKKFTDSTEEVDLPVRFPPSYGSPSGYFDGRKWISSSEHSRTDTVDISGDSTVRGTPGYGMEFATTPYLTMKRNPKEIIMELKKAITLYSKKSKPSVSGFTKVTPNPFGSSVSKSNYTHSGSGSGFGSYHLTFTFPFDKDKDSEEYRTKYYNDVYRGLKVVRAIQPLIMAMIGGVDLKAIGNPDYAEGSGRQVYNSFGNLGNVSLDQEFLSHLISGNISDNKRAKYKYGNYPTPQFKKDIRASCDAFHSYSSEVGDIVPKKFSNSPVKSVEIRFLDNFYFDELYQMTKVILLAMQHGKDGGTITDSKTSSEWNKATQLILEEGWNTILSKDFVKMLSSKLDLNLTKKDLRADVVFNEVALQLWEKNKNGDWYKTFFNGDLSKPVFKNLNRMNWDAQFRYKILNNSEFKKYFLKVIKVINEIDATDSNGWIKLNWKDGKYAIRDIMFDDIKYGLDIATEDFEDIIYLLERMDLVEIKNKPNKSIDKIKKKFSNVDEVMEKLENLMLIDGEDLFSDIQEPEPIIPQPQPEPVESNQRFTRLNSDDSSINMDNLLLGLFTPSEENELDREDLEQVFKEANFLVNDRRIPIVIKYADIVYDGTNINSFWIKKQSFIMIYLSRNFLDLQSVSKMVMQLKKGFYSPQSITENKIFATGITQDEFFNRLKTIASRQYDKGSNSITLDRAGIKTLENQGVYILSLNRGEKYFIADKNKWSKLGSNIKKLNYIPYNKGMKVEVKGQLLKLKKGQSVVDVLRRN